MRRSNRKFVAGLLLTVIGFTPLLEVLAIDSALPSSMTACQIALAGESNATPSADPEATMDCAQHHACISYCQFAPLLSGGPHQVGVSSLPWLAIPDQAKDFSTRFLESIERPPRV